MKAKFTIERISEPATPGNRYLGTKHGKKVWTSVLKIKDHDVFDSQRAADTYRVFRMAEHADDCHVVRHAVH